MRWRWEQISVQLRGASLCRKSRDRRAAVPSDFLLSFLVYACQEAVPCNDRQYFQRADSDGCNCKKCQKRASECKVVFIGPCAAKKLEASRRSVRSDVDFVVTFEELQAMFDAKEIDLSQYEAESSFHDATGAGRGYACAGGVAEAIEKCINEYYPDVEVSIEHAEGLPSAKRH